MERAISLSEDEMCRVVGGCRGWRSRQRCGGDGGAAGGFGEKLAAARDAGAELVIIGRPEETGDDLEDVLAWLLETGRQKEERAWK